MQRFYGDATDSGGFFFENFSVSGKASARSDTHDELINIFSQHAYDFPGHAVICTAVVNIVKLVGPECIWLLAQLPGPFNQVSDEFCSYLTVFADQDFQLGTKCTHRLKFFFCKSIRRNKLCMIASVGTHHSQ